jgi:nucleoside-diphosphate-sugar epimerase
MTNKKDKIIISGAAGLVGQNLILLLRESGYRNIVALDKHLHNLEILKKVNPDIKAYGIDLSEPGSWQKTFEKGEIVVMLQSQIAGKNSHIFLKNTVKSTEVILETARKYSIPYVINVSSSVVISVADDDYTRAKKKQESLVEESQINFCTLRPPLMFGWFDRKHLGWLSRFMERFPIYPVPGNGKYLRQPLYVRDFCRVIIKCIELRPPGKIFNIIGRENLDYIDIIRAIKRIKGLRTLILKLPYGLFYVILKLYSYFDKDPPFTVEQLKALTAGDVFPVEPWWEEFQVQPSRFEEAMTETHTDPVYSKYILKF